MKKSILIPLLLFVAVFCVSQFVQPYSLIQLENQGLFLLAPDWFREVMAGRHPLTELVGSFLVQFYDIPVVGALITAAVIVLIYWAVDRILGRFRLPFHRLVALVAALLCWVFTAGLDSNLPVVQIMLIAVLAGLLSSFIRRREEKPAHRWELPVAAALVLIAAAYVATDSGIRDAERLPKVQVNARRLRWDKVLEAATPEASASDPRLMPFAFLALGETGGLGDRLFKYPVSGPEDFDMEGDNSLTGCLYNSLLAESLGVPNEAIHHIFQYSCHLPHGMSHLSLYQLIRYNAVKGDFTMVRKYAGILGRNPKNRVAARGILRRYASSADVKDTLGHSSASARMVTNNPQYNLAQMSLLGLSSVVSVNRFLCYQLLVGDIEGFRNSFETLGWQGTVPVHYQEALLLAGADPDAIGVSEERAKHFSDFLSAMSNLDNATVQSAARGTYWEYYLKVQDREFSGDDSDLSYPAS